MIELSVSQPFVYLLLMFLPGVVFALSAFKKRLLVERILLGSFISYASIQILGAFLLLLSVPFSAVVVYAVIGILLLLSIAYALKNGISIELEREKENALTSIALLAVVYLAFVLRFSTLNPIYYELDPYFYLYSSYQLIGSGTIPPVDDTAWYPVINSTHRQIPGLSFFISSLYVLSQGPSVDAYRLSFVANYYPPLAGLFAAFLAYLVFRERFNPSIGLLAAIVFATTPVLMAKMFSGVFEGQPNGLLWHVAAIASLYLLIRRQDVLHALLAGLVFINYFTSTTQALLGVGIMVAYFLALLLKKELNSWLLIIPFLAFAASQLFMLLYTPQYGISKITLLATLGSSFFAAAIYFREHLEKYYAMLKANTTLFYGVVAISALVGVFILLQVSQSLVSVGSYTSPLVRTIAEQQPTPSSVEGSLGILGHDFFDANNNPRYGVASNLLAFPSRLSRAVFELSVKAIEATGAIVPYVQKVDSLFFYIYGYVLALTAYSVWRYFSRGEEIDSLLIMVAALFMAMSFVGLVLVKYSVQLALATFLAASYVLGHAVVSLKDFLSGKGLLNQESVPFVPLASLLLAGAVVNANLIGPLGIPNIAYSAAEKPAFSSTAFNDSFGDMCRDDYCANPELTIAQVCSLYPELKSVCVLVPKEAKVGELCGLGQKDAFCRLAKGDVPPYEQFSKNNCVLHFIVEKEGKVTPDEQAAISRACGSSLPGVWMEAMDWIRENVEDGARITSWWDYGHWINYWGEKKAVIRNDQASLEMIGDVAHAYIMANLSDFNSITALYDSDYALFDREILFSGRTFGGKFFALNYLACARNNLTDVSKSQLQSQCERDNLWEVIYPSNEPCTISNITGKKGVVGYSIQGGIFSVEDRARVNRAYCLTNDRVFIDGREEVVSYYLNETIAPGELKLNKAFLIPQGDSPDAGFVALYTKENVWVVNGTLQNGWEDRKGRFYDSILYNAFVLNELPGWEKVFDNGYVKLYRRSEE